ncbi:MAG: GtrA family protein [Clostridia bacterium]|nr:GtrA family protein [Clostridia bacterium]
MNKIKELYLKHKEVVLYILFGIATTLVDTLMFWLFDSLFGEGLYLLSTLLAWALAALFAYFVNKLFVFESKSWKQITVAKEALEFFGARVVSLGISELGMYLFVDVWKFKDIGFKFLFVFVTGTLIAKVIMSVIVIVLNYFFSKFIIFRKDEQDKLPDGEEKK